ncbi:CatB-related O-acetyltransferase [Nitrosophilus labii]|uniref:CatB-related O-acetyltransferase n=1 Tax=Nitrosophilus labii TaxID=2706014 RepID=UPI0024842E4F|nr:CatB-related O-acetyltransferase [Nitrosophilus labii]
MKTILKKMYYVYFFFIKFFKYPTAKIYTNFIMPGVKIGKYVIIREGCKIQKDVEIGDYTFVNENTQIDTNTKKIGKFCSISHGVKIGLGPHPLHFFSTSPVFYEPYRGYVKKQLYNEFEDKGYTEIGNDVLIGANAIILAGVKVGNGAVIGTGSVVTKDVPPYAIVAGNPAKVIRYRFSEDIIEKLLELKWWDMNIKDILRYQDYFDDIAEFIKVLDENSKRL